MSYIILTEKTRQRAYPGKDEENFYSSTHGMFSKYKNAAIYSTFEAAQPTVQKLRQGSPEVFISAVLNPY